VKKIKIIFLSLGFLAVSNAETVTIIATREQKPQWKQFFQQYVASIGTGAVVGVSIDVITDYFFEKISPGARTMPGVLLAFLIQSWLKSKLLSEIKKDMHRYNIPHKDFLMYWTAHLTPFRSLLKDIYLSAQGRKNYARYRRQLA